MSTREDKAACDLLAAELRRAGRIRAYVIGDQAIDAARIQANLERPLRAAGCDILLSAEIIAAVRDGDRLTSITVRTPDGRRHDYDCALCFNVAGASMERVMAVLNPQVAMVGMCQRLAAAVLRFDWPWHQLPPMILQMFGSHQAPLLKNHSIIPVGADLRRASVSSSGGIAIDDEGFVPHDLEAARRELVDLMREAFDLKEVTGQDIRWCVKGLFAPPEVRRQEGDSAARLVTCLSASLVGGSSNLYLCSPGKLTGVVGLMEAVAAVARGRHGAGRRRAA